MKRVISLLLIFCLVFTMGFVLADDAETSTGSGEATPVAISLNYTNETGIEPTEEPGSAEGPRAEEPPLIGGCGTVTPGLNDECCRNLGLDKWDQEIGECVLEGELIEIEEGEVDPERVCCKAYGIGTAGEEVNVHYAYVLRERCSVPEDFVGGNREVVDGEICRERLQKRIVAARKVQAVKATKNGEVNERPIEVQQVIQTRNRLEYKIQEANGTCPENCTCDGSAMKCKTQDGSREMIIQAGNSGNTIVQVKNTNMSTRVQLYKADDGGVFGVFANNQTKRIILPDEAREKLHEAMKKRIKEEDRERKMIALEEENITLNEDGNYNIEARKRARLLWVIPVKERVKTQIDAETGTVLRERHSWWGFLARDVRVEETEESTE